MTRILPMKTCTACLGLMLNGKHLCPTCQHPSYIKPIRVHIKGTPETGYFIVPIVKDELPPSEKFLTYLAARKQCGANNYKFIPSTMSQY